jgi:hypothetical protein
MGNRTGPDKKNLPHTWKKPSEPIPRYFTEERGGLPTSPAMESVISSLAQRIRWLTPKNPRRIGESHSWLDWNHGVSHRVAS